MMLGFASSLSYSMGGTREQKKFDFIARFWEGKSIR